MRNVSGDQAAAGEGHRPPGVVAGKKPHPAKWVETRRHGLGDSQDAGIVHHENFAVGDKIRPKAEAIIRRRRPHRFAIHAQTGEPPSRRHAVNIAFIEDRRLLVGAKHARRQPKYSLWGDLAALIDQLHHHASGIISTRHENAVADYHRRGHVGDLHGPVRGLPEHSAVFRRNPDNPAAGTVEIHPGPPVVHRNYRGVRHRPGRRIRRCPHHLTRGAIDGDHESRPAGRDNRPALVDQGTPARRTTGARPCDIPSPGP